MTDSPIARRKLLKGARLRHSAGLVWGGKGVQAEVAAADASAGAIWSHDYWAKKGDVKLACIAKRVGEPAAGAKPLPVLFLVHGSSLSSLSSLTLPFPAKANIRSWTSLPVTASTSGPWTMKVTAVLRRRREIPTSPAASPTSRPRRPCCSARPAGRNFISSAKSSGAIRAGAFAQAKPERVERLILTAFTYKGGGAAEIDAAGASSPNCAPAPRRKRDAAMIHSIFSRDGHPSAYDPAVAEAIVASEMKFGDTVPSGTYIDMAANLPLVDPTKVMSPVLMTRGEWDGNSTNADLLDLLYPIAERRSAISPFCPTRRTARRSARAGNCCGTR